jgi:hypothetical protein
MSPSWQEKRIQLNHDWFSRYIVSLNKWLGLMNQDLKDFSFETRFIEDVFVQWSDNEQEVLTLIGDFEKEMSPRSLFYLPPLSRCDENTKSWLTIMVHELWCCRYPVKEWVNTAIKNAKTAKSFNDKIQIVLKTHPEFRLSEELRPWYEEFQNFRDACKVLSESISKFPREVKII